MKLDSISYKQNEDSTDYWGFKDLKLRGIDLIVGKNTSGKTRVLNVISSLAQWLEGEKESSFSVNEYNAGFSNFENTIKFKLGWDGDKIGKEYLERNGEELLSRSASGETKIKGMELGEMIHFGLSENELASRRADTVQFPFLQDLQNWASSVRHFRFNTDLGKRTINILDSEGARELNIKRTDEVVSIFLQGEKKYPEEFKKSIVSDLNEIGYQIENISVGTPNSMRVNFKNSSKNIVCLLLKECDREGLTDQYSMSMGLFRVLSLLIHFNYWRLEKIDGLVLVDDIGEGLDYEKSTKFIKLLIRKGITDGTQLIMTTNNQFVMNLVPLEYWQIIDRVGGEVKFYNKENSEKTFEEFKFVGMNNFDFFTTGFEDEKLEEN
jgi:hypothetical protein